MPAPGRALRGIQEFSLTALRSLAGQPARLDRAPCQQKFLNASGRKDLIRGFLGYSDWHRLSEQLQSRGFRISMQESVNCRFRLDGLQVDFMPDDEAVLGFTNRWYTQALKSAAQYELPSTTIVRVVTPLYFLATKLEAYKGRGCADPLSSHDIEDLLNVVDGRPELLTELQQADGVLRQYLAKQFAQLLEHRDIAYVVQSTAMGSAEREAIIFNRLEQIATRT